MDYTNKDVMMGDCKAVGIPRTERELIATRHYKIPASIVRECDKQVNSKDYQVFQDFITKYTTNDQPEKVSSSKGGKRNENKKGVRTSDSGDGKTKTSEGDKSQQVKVADDDLSIFTVEKIREIKRDLKSKGISHANFLSKIETIEKAKEMGIL